MRWLRIIAGFFMHRLRAGGHPKANLLNENAKAPDFHLPDESGQFHRLSDYRGSKVVLWFYVRARTPGWTIEGGRFRDRIEDFQHKNAVVFGISTDSPEENRRFKEEERFPFHLLSDMDRSACLAYGACSFQEAYYANRITYIIDEKGLISKVYAKVDPSTHSAEVLTAL